MSSKTKPKRTTQARVGAESSSWIVPAIYIVILAACAVIFAAARGDLWLDEIWSIVFAREAKRAIDVVLLPQLHHDNNHILNTMYLHVVGNQTAVYVYRLLAIVSGAASLWLVALLAKKWGSLESLLSVLLSNRQ